MNKKLYKITITGLHNKGGRNHNETYVVDYDPTSAYKKVKDFLDNNDIGFKSERELKYIELIAEDTEYPNTEHRLFT